MLFLPEGYQLILGSKSPRRQELLRSMGYNFEVRNVAVEEVYDPKLQGVEIAEYLARLKAESIKPGLKAGEILLTSDTVVWCDGQSLAKAANKPEARKMLKLLSGKTHEVITGVCLLSSWHAEVFSSSTLVQFAPLKEEEIAYYVDTFLPLDKAGAYGIQEWIGMWAIEKIVGSYFNVVGLPTHLLPGKLRNFW